jgi:hypothetical protein
MKPAVETCQPCGSLYCTGTGDAMPVQYSGLVEVELQRAEHAAGAGLVVVRHHRWVCGSFVRRLVLDGGG